MKRVLACLAIMMAFFVQTAEAGKEGRITKLKIEKGKTDEGGEAKIVRIEAKRNKKYGKQVCKLRVQVKDKDGKVYFAEVTSSGGSSNTSGGSSTLKITWTFKVDVSDIEKAKISCEAILIEESSKKEIFI